MRLGQFKKVVTIFGHWGRVDRQLCLKISPLLKLLLITVVNKHWVIQGFFLIFNQTLVKYQWIITQVGTITLQRLLRREKEFGNLLWVLKLVQLFHTLSAGLIQSQSCRIQVFCQLGHQWLDFVWFLSSICHTKLIPKLVANRLLFSM